MKATIYAVETTEAHSGERIISRYFSTLRAARNWRKWCAAQRCFSSARILAGGPGGMEVA